jgi:hypothetical protein
MTKIDFKKNAALALERAKRVAVSVAESDLALLALLAVGIGLVSVPAALIVAPVLAFIIPIGMQVIDEWFTYGHQHRELLLAEHAKAVGVQVGKQPANPSLEGEAILRQQAFSEQMAQQQQAFTHIDL